jgi:hypothetical protein
MIAWACRVNRKRPLLLWLARGGAGVTLLVAAAFTQAPVIVLAAVVTALIAFGGCPMCWTFGLLERIRVRVIPPRHERGPR